MRNQNRHCLSIVHEYVRARLLITLMAVIFCHRVSSFHPLTHTIASIKVCYVEGVAHFSWAN